MRLCACGCGAEVNTARAMYLPGHQSRKSPVDIIIDPETGCHIWQGATNNKGYGTKLDPATGKLALVHRLAYEEVYGPIPEGLVIDHVKARRCRHKTCINPDHLEPVTVAENNRRGKLTILTAQQVYCIKQMKGAVTQAQIAAAYRVSIWTVRNIWQGRRWKDVQAA